MKKYKRLKLLRTYGPIFIGITIAVIQNLILGIIMALVWIVIDLIFIGPKLHLRRKRQEGEIFIIEPIKNKFFFAKVIRTQIPINDPIMNGGHLVYIFNETDNPINIPDYLDPSSLVIPPQIIDNTGWNKGYYQTVGVKPVTHQERELNYGFWDVKTKKFINEEGTELNYTPNIYSYFGISSYGSISDELKEKLDSSYQI